MADWISRAEWETIVQNVPIPSVDLVVECPDGVVLAERTNRPAKGEWFVPGSRVHKGERLVEAVHRVAETELGVSVTIEEDLGTFEHFYSHSEVGERKHYIAHGYRVWTEAVEFETDEQHNCIRVFEEFTTGLHKYVRSYIKNVEFDGLNFSESNT